MIFHYIKWLQSFPDRNHSAFNLIHRERYNAKVGHAGASYAHHPPQPSPTDPSAGVHNPGVYCIYWQGILNITNSKPEV